MSQNIRRRDTPRSFGTPSFGKASPGTAVLEEDEEEEEAEAEMSRLAEESAAKAREVPEPAVAYKDFEVVMIRKDGCSLGISISGGVDCNPRYRADNDHVYVTKVNPGGLADKAGDIQPGDQIIAVNDTDYTGGISHEQAVSVLKATDGTVKFVLRREVYTDESAPVTINVIPAVVEKDNDEDDLERRTDTPPTPEETKRNLVALPEERTLVEGMEMVTINRGEEALGMTIVGGSDTSPLPFGSQAPDDKGVYISKIVPDGLVASSGQLRVGDQIISVNDSELTGTQHSTAVACLVGTSVLKLIVRHVGPPPGIMEVVFAKAPEEKLGMSIRGGSGAAKSGNPFDDRDEGIFISKINPGGAAHRSGKFRQGQRILEVNGNTLLGATHHEAVHVLKSIGQTVKFVVCDGYEPPESELQSLDASLVSQVSAVSQAVPASTGTTEPLSNASSQPLTPPSEPVSPPEEAVSQPTEAVSLPTDTVSQPAESSAAVPEQVGSVEASTEVVAAPETAEPTRTTPEVIVSSPSEDRGDEQDILAEKPRTTSWADEVEATEAAATEAAAAEVASTEAAAAASENTVEVGGHALRSTPVREARQKSGSESGAVSSPSHSTATPDSLDAGENDGEGAAASPSSSSSSASKAKKKKHKKHKKRHAEEGEGAEGKEHRHRRKQRKDGDAAAGGGNA
ncbi:protein scribble homolog isoform X2 [Sycon ciliatum]|uniref:protein scribble homolog isoform X2 n=1 Tax=Sycon ciliatum TaxID=27933 RepID=UPI0031F65454